MVVSNETDCSIRVIVHYHNVGYVNLLTSPEHLETINRTDQINKGSLYCVHLIDHLHTSLKEFIKVLIAVTSRLDAAVACINVLHPMENQ